MVLGSSGSHFGSRKIEIWYFYFFSASFCFKLITLQICCATKGSQPKRPAEQIVDSSFLSSDIFAFAKNLGLSWPLKLNFLPDIFLLFSYPFISFTFSLRLPWSTVWVTIVLFCKILACCYQPIIQPQHIGVKYSGHFLWMCQLSMSTFPLQDI